LDELAPKLAQLRAHHFLSENQLPNSIAFSGRTFNFTRRQAILNRFFSNIPRKLGYRYHLGITNEIVDSSYAAFCIAEAHRPGIEPADEPHPPAA
jgi:hypothetical protein